MTVPATNWSVHDVPQHGAAGPSPLLDRFVMPGTPRSGPRRRRQRAFAATQLATCGALIPMAGSILLATGPSWPPAALLLLGQALVFPLLLLAQRRTGAAAVLGLLSITSFHALLFTTACNFGGLGSPALMALPIGIVVSVLFLPRRWRLLGTGSALLGLQLLLGLHLAGHAFPQNLPAAAALPVGITWLLSAAGYLYAMASYYARLRSGLDGHLRDEVARCQALAEGLNSEWQRNRRPQESKAQYLSALGEQFAAPVRALVGLSRLVAEDGDKDPEQARLTGCARDIERSGLDLLQQLRAIGDLASGDAANLEPAADPVDLRRTVRRGLGQLAPMLRSAGVTVQSQLPAGPVMVCGDDGELREMVDCLLLNAVRYNRRGGVVRVALLDAGARVALVVQDTGVGMSPDRLESLRRRLRMAAPDGPESGRARGLRKAGTLVRKHGGRLKIDSRRHRGTRVEVVLPTGRSEAGSARLRVVAGAD